MKTTLVKITSRCWQWNIETGPTLHASGYCATKKDAVSDAAVWIAAHQTPSDE